MNFSSIIENIFDQYKEAWNKRDLHGIMSSFSESALFESTRFEHLANDQEGIQLRGKESIQNYYKAFFSSSSYFPIEKIDVSSKDKVVTARVKAIGTSHYLKETFRLNEYGKLEYLSIATFKREVPAFSIFNLWKAN
ncbi:MAG TPA: nuclear transport factor 2 family protein [Chitinophagaceae bacterium]|nr:nuclear transport factor 2 family protein [Chitinophagaceae bacterium]